MVCVCVCSERDNFVGYMCMYACMYVLTVLWVTCMCVSCVCVCVCVCALGHVYVCVVYVCVCVCVDSAAGSTLMAVCLYAFVCV